jgi:hypothetical protein
LDEYVVSNSLVSPEVANNGKEPPRSLQRRRDRHHHHLLRAASSLSSGTMWVNLHLLFWLSLMPFTTGWMGENDFARLPTKQQECRLQHAGDPGHYLGQGTRCASRHESDHQEDRRH